MTPSRLRPTARTVFAALAALALALTNVAAGCPGDPPPLELPTLATTAGVGTLPGRTGVTDDGAFTYSAPIPLPPGRAGMQPSFALSYSSTPSESSLGVGFAVSGLSSIARCDQIPAIDGQRRGVSLDDEDRLCLDGARLVAVEGADMQPGTVYRTEEETWRQIETSGSDAGGISGPTSFLVRLPDGRERLYGASEDSRLVLTRADGARVVATWHLTQERDPRGNAIRYEYRHITPSLPAEIAASADPDPPVRDLVLVSRVRYTGTASADGTTRVDGSRAVEFEYRSTARTPPVGFSEGLVEPPGPEDGYVHGNYGWTPSAFPLERIRTSIAGNPVHEVRFEFDESPVFRRPLRLTSARLCSYAPPAPGTVLDAGAVCMPATHFRWRNATAPDAEISDERYGAPTFESFALPMNAADNERQVCGTSPGGSPVLCDGIWPAIALDANGDGADDLLYLRRRRDPLSPVLALRFGRYAARSTASIAPADVPLGELRNIELVADRPGRDLEDVAFYVEWASSVDWNLDGRDDLVLLVPAVEENLWEVIVAVSSGGARFQLASTGLFMPRALSQREFWDGATPGRLDSRAVQRSIEVLDVNGDGRTDVVACLTEEDVASRFFLGGSALAALRGRWWYALRNEDGTLGVPTAGGHRRLSATNTETTCATEYSPLGLHAGGTDPDASGFESIPVSVDTDGDGNLELLIAPPWFTPRGVPARTANMRLLRWSGTELVEVDTSIPVDRYQAFDANGDGLHDLIANHVNAPIDVPAEPEDVLTVAYLSRGDGSFERVDPDVWIPDSRRARVRRRLLEGEPPGEWDRTPLPLLGFDMDGDNRGDLLTLAVPAGSTRPIQIELPGQPPGFDSQYYRWSDNRVHVTSFLNGTYDVTYDAGVTVAGDQYAAENPLDGVYYQVRTVVMDADGDGALDFVAFSRVGREARRRIPLDLDLHYHHNVRSQPSLVEAVTDGFGAETIVRYTPLSDSTVYRPARDCSYPTRCTTDSRYVAQFVWHDDGSDGRAYVEEQHYYQGGRTNLEGRGFLGFQRHAVRNTLTGAPVDRRFDNTTYDPVTHTYPLAGRPRAVMRYVLDLDADDRGDTQFVGSKETLERELVTTPEGTHYTVVTSTISRAFEENLVPVPVIFGGDPFVGLSPLQEVRRAVGHDDFGNTTWVVERITGVPGLSRTDATFINDTARWRIGLPESSVSRTVESGECSLFERTTYGVDVALAEIVSVTRTGRVADPSVDRTTSVTRDARGNIESLTMATTMPTAPARTVTLTYEPTGYFVESITNALGHRTELSVEPRFGQVYDEVDANGVETARSFDGFGRLRREESIGRGGAEISYELADDVGRHEVRIEPDGGGRDVVEYDRLGRAVESQVQHAFVTSYAARRFDRLGRLVLETEPFTNPAFLADPETTPHIRMEHDDMGRLLSTLSADGVRTDYRYPRNVREVQTEGAGEYVTELDRAGRVLAVEEPERR